MVEVPIYDSLLQRAEVRCSIETLSRPSTIAHSIKLQRAEVRCSIETSIHFTANRRVTSMLQRAEVRCSIETDIRRRCRCSHRRRCSARKCAALLRRRGRLISSSTISAVAARGSALLY